MLMNCQSRQGVDVLNVDTFFFLDICTSLNYPYNCWHEQYNYKIPKLLLYNWNPVWTFLLSKARTEIQNRGQFDQSEMFPIVYELFPFLFFGHSRLLLLLRKALYNFLSLGGIPCQENKWIMYLLNSYNSRFVSERVCFATEDLEESCAKARHFSSFLEGRVETVGYET